MPAADLLALIAPPVCSACSAPLAEAGGRLCPGCLRSLPWLPARVCRRCGLPRHGGRACPGIGAAFQTAWAPLAYAGPALSLVRALKFRSALPAAGLMAAQMAANAPPWALGAAAPFALTPSPGPVTPVAFGPDAHAFWAAAAATSGRDAQAFWAAATTAGRPLTAADVAVVAVPAAHSRERKRGFDPAALIAAGVARRLGLPVAGCLARSGRAVRQLGARREQRTAAGRIQVRLTEAPPRVVILVDDVHTTGATLRACAQTLSDGGSTAVHALTYARAL